MQQVLKLVDFILTVAPPFTIGVYGGWGEGKTSFVRLVEHYLRQAALPAAVSEVLFVTFTAWPYKSSDELWRALAFTGFFLNLFNLLPVVPLDGGRAMAAMAPWMWFVGFAALVGVTIAFPNPILLIILLFGGMETWRRWRQRRAGGEEQADYYRVTPRARAAVAAVYVGLIVALAVGMDLSHVPRTLG